MKYSELRDRLDTGDLVFFSGKGLVSAGIQWITRSKWSHVGMVVAESRWDMLLIYESTTLSNLADVDSGTPMQGVQLVPLSARIRSYDGDVGVRFLDPGLDVADRLALGEFRREIGQRPYEQSKLELFRAAYDGPFGANATEDVSSLFCSELIAETYQRIGLLDNTGTPSNEYTPKDFATMRLASNHKLSEIQIVTKDSA